MRKTTGGKRRKKKKEEKTKVSEQLRKMAITTVVVTVNLALYSSHKNWRGTKKLKTNKQNKTNNNYNKEIKTNNNRHSRLIASVTVALVSTPLSFTLHL